MIPRSNTQGADMVYDGYQSYDYKDNMRRNRDAFDAWNEFTGLVGVKKEDGTIDEDKLNNMDLDEEQFKELLKFMKKCMSTYLSFRDPDNLDLAKKCITLFNKHRANYSDDVITSGTGNPMENINNFCTWISKAQDDPDTIEYDKYIDMWESWQFRQWGNCLTSLYSKSAFVNLMDRYCKGLGLFADKDHIPSYFEKMVYMCAMSNDGELQYWVDKCQKHGLQMTCLPDNARDVMVLAKKREESQKDKILSLYKKLNLVAKDIDESALLDMWNQGKLDEIPADKIDEFGAEMFLSLYYLENNNIPPLILAKAHKYCKAHKNWQDELPCCNGVIDEHIEKLVSGQYNIDSNNIASVYSANMEMLNERLSDSNCSEERKKKIKEIQSKLNNLMNGYEKKYGFVKWKKSGKYVPVIKPVNKIVKNFNDVSAKLDKVDVEKLSNTTTLLNQGASDAKAEIIEIAKNQAAQKLCIQNNYNEKAIEDALNNSIKDVVFKIQASQVVNPKAYTFSSPSYKTDLLDDVKNNQTFLHPADVEQAKDLFAADADAFVKRVYEKMPDTNNIGELVDGVYKPFVNTNGSGQSDPKNANKPDKWSVRKELLKRALASVAGAFLASTVISFVATTAAPLVSTPVLLSVTAVLAGSLLKIRKWKKDRAALGKPTNLKYAFSDKAFLKSLGVSAVTIAAMCCGSAGFVAAAKCLGFGAIAWGGYKNTMDIYAKATSMGLGKKEAFFWAVGHAIAVAGAGFAGRITGNGFAADNTDGVTENATADDKNDAKTDVAETKQTETPKTVESKQTEPVKTATPKTEIKQVESSDLNNLQKQKIGLEKQLADCTKIVETKVYTDDADNHAKSIVEKWYADRPDILDQRVKMVQDANARYGTSINPYRAILLHADAGGKTYDNIQLASGGFSRGNHTIFGPGWIESQDDVDVSDVADVKNMFAGNAVSEDSIRAADKLDAYVSPKNHISCVAGSGDCGKGTYRHFDSNPEPFTIKSNTVVDKQCTTDIQSKIAKLDEQIVNMKQVELNVAADTAESTGCSITTISDDTSNSTPLTDSNKRCFGMFDVAGIFGQTKQMLKKQYEKMKWRQNMFQWFGDTYYKNR